VDRPVRQARVAQITADQLLELREGEASEIGRQLLGPDLKQKGRHGAGPQQPTSLLTGPNKQPEQPRRTDASLRSILAMNGV
jgi:hypothetical protein